MCGAWEEVITFIGIPYSFIIIMRINGFLQNHIFNATIKDRAVLRVSAWISPSNAFGP